jgi:putative polyhydroxyalkanoate system protein
LAEIHIVREHALGLEQARKLAFRWAEVAEKKLDMHCTYAEGESYDVVSFRRPGAHGELRVSAARFELRARLGLLLGVFRHKIESEITRNLDLLLAQQDPLHAFEEGLVKHEARQGARHAPKHAKPHGEVHKAAAKPAAKAAPKPASKPAAKAKAAPARKPK